jgi:hypothetical protein
MVADPFIDPDLAFRLMLIGSWLLILMGAGKLAVYLVGEFAPQAYAKVRSVGFKRFLTGTGNRLVFGLLGAFTLLLGVVFLGLAYLVRHLFSLTGVG